MKTSVSCPVPVRSAWKRHSLIAFRDPGLVNAIEHVEHLLAEQLRELHPHRFADHILAAHERAVGRVDGVEPEVRARHTAQHDRRVLERVPHRIERTGGMQGDLVLAHESILTHACHPPPYHRRRHALLAM